MNINYEKPVLDLNFFDNIDVITTSSVCELCGESYSGIHECQEED